MSNTKDKEKKKEDEKSEGKGSKTLSLGKGTLSLKDGASSTSRNISPGRGHQGSNVAVEVRRKRTRTPDKAATESDQDTTEAHQLTSEEREARIRALEEAQEYSRQKKEKQESLKKAQEQSEAEKKEEAEQEKQRAIELEELQKIEAEEQWKREQEQKKAGPDKPAPGGRSAKSKDDISAEDRAEEESYRSKMKKAARRPARGGGGRRRSGKLTVTQVLNEDYDKDKRLSLAAQKRARQKAKMTAPGTGHDAPSKVTRDVIVPETITVQELANRMAERGGDIVKELMKMGVMATINQTIDADTAELLVHEFGHKIRRVTEADIEEGLEGVEDENATLKPRPPVVTIMGHVDHGKTSLLDALRKTDVVSGEAGGITQHIGAYQVTMPGGAKITFLDTPGHAAFTEMRARGANVTDIVVIVVAANDSLMPQTIEAINHAKAAEVPVIIAINKIDLPDADPKKVKNDLLSHEIIVEEMGGEVICLEVSALKRQNLDKLEEMILLQAELLDLKSNPDRQATGTVVESKLEQGRGNVATVLVEKGTLKIGDVFVVGSEWGKVRALINDRGQNVDDAVPGQPVEILGLDGAPEAGDRLVVVREEAKARDVAEYRQRKKREAASVLAAGSSSLEEMLEAAKEGDKQQLAIVIKGDVHGSVEAIVGSLKKIEDENEDVIVNVLHSGVGAITESDVTLANASNGLIIGFNVRANTQARELAERDGVEIRYYNVIYNVIDDARNVLSGMLEPTMREEYQGQAEIRQVFRITKVGNVAGCMVTDGTVRRGSKVRLLRDNVVIHEGTLKTLKRYQDEVKEVKEGMECGMAFENYDDIKEKDVIECYDIIEEERTLA